MNKAIQLNLWDWLEEASIAASQVPELVAVSDGVAALDSVMEDDDARTNPGSALGCG